MILLNYRVLAFYVVDIATLWVVDCFPNSGLISIAHTLAILPTGANWIASRIRIPISLRRINGIVLPYFWCHVLKAFLLQFVFSLRTLKYFHKTFFTR